MRGMAFEIPQNLHPDMGPVVWMLGTWQGNGHGAYPTIESFEYGQELIFAQDGRPFFHYMARSWIIDPETGEKIRDAAIETGFLRCKQDANGVGAVEFVMTHNTGIVEIWVGTAEGGKLEIVTDAVGRTETAQPYTAGKRLYGNVEGDLLYAFDMAAMGQPLQSHLWARLQRV
jgi:hypothetical protein